MLSGGPCRLVAMGGRTGRGPGRQRRRCPWPWPAALVLFVAGCTSGAPTAVAPTARPASTTAASTVAGPTGAAAVDRLVVGNPPSDLTPYVRARFGEDW